MSTGTKEETQIESFATTYNVGSGVSTTTTIVARAAGSIPAGGTGAAAGAWDTAANRDTAITTIGEMKDTLNNLTSDFNDLSVKFSRLIETLRERRLMPQ
mgnify:CR=1 FL=1